MQRLVSVLMVGAVFFAGLALIFTAAAVLAIARARLHPAPAYGLDKAVWRCSASHVETRALSGRREVVCDRYERARP